MKTALRTRVEELGRAGEFSAKDVLIPDITTRGVAIYLARLVNDEVLNIAKTTYRRGPGFGRWCGKAPKTRPGGNASAYRASALVRSDAASMEFLKLVSENRNKVSDTNPMVPAKHWDQRFSAIWRKG